MDDIELWRVTKALVLLALANGAPVIGQRFFGARFGWPVDGGRNFPDGRPLFGPTKTVRGLVLAVLATALAAPLLGIGWGAGALIGIVAMLGDLASSFIKRRLGLPSSSQALGLDQLPESLLPLLACRASLGLDATGIIATVAAFVVLELVLSKLLYRLHIRERPY